MKKLSQLGMFAAALACLFLSPSYAVAQDKDEKGEYDFDATGIRLDIPTDI